MSDQPHNPDGAELFHSDGRWFQELPRLLDSYAEVRHPEEPGGTPGDVDRDDRPSLAMRSYLRTAARHPGRAARVISEIEILVKHGPTDEVLLQLADSGIRPDRLGSSDDVSLGEHFGRMLPHLRAFVANGEQVEDRAPETRWEWRQRFPELKSLLGAHFYMYWKDDYADHDAVISEYLDELDQETGAAVLQDIVDVRAIARTEKELERAFRVLGYHGYPPKGMKWSQWLNRIEERVRQHLDAQ
jgi:hypothetical protein